MLIDLIAGARPNFMKIAPIVHEIIKLNDPEINYRLIHTGQHYDKNMSETFFEQLDIPQPDVRLGSIGSSVAEQTGSIMVKYENLLKVEKPDLCLVVGDVTSTMACSIVARKLQVNVAHVEAGIRSGDWSMPEEINRIITDSISDLFFTTTLHASQNLLSLGVDSNKIHFVGNTMIDTLLKNKLRFRKPSFWEKFNFDNNRFLVLTLHRPSNVDDVFALKILLESIIDSVVDSKIVFPIHPRTLKNFEKLNFHHNNLIIVEPLGYLEFNYLVQKALCVITDSGGITEETTFLGIPCLTLRDNTERPETVEIGTNELIGSNPCKLKEAMERLYLGKWKKGQIPEYWDGLTSKRIVKHVVEFIKKNSN
jgi:UDP-N-acetylglucosamine 2-epimerase (non-hydrolysing)